MSDTATVPTDEQLKDYAAQLPDLYKDILAAIPVADPHRGRGEGVHPGSLRATLVNLSYPAYRPMMETRVARDPGWRYDFSHSLDRLTDKTFDIALDRLAESGFILDPLDTDFGVLVPTPLGEQLIAAITGRATPERDVPALPKPTW